MIILPPCVIVLCLLFVMGVFLALGSNLGDREANLRNAINALPPMVNVVRESPIYETEPWGFEDQPKFLNQVVEAETDLPPFELLSYIKKIETELGREPTFRYGPRLIDLDILFYDNLIIRRPTLTIPHPKLHERSFVLTPLADLAPDFMHPVLHKTIQQLLKNLNQEDIQSVKKAT
ncbi:2-amino-4-hydroxy-6-hydroxymethyldihydropteridine diphosphokinase [bacterium]|nr:2-amino-4-hydroxy-6-hydroxymethyldihydropteridine diphosphokinase [bacterium]